MALVAANATIQWPGVARNCGAVPAVGNDATINASGDYSAQIFCAREAMTITGIGFRAGAATSTPEVIVQVEGVGTDGLPDGVVNGTASVATAVTGSVWNAIALQANATVTAGTLVALKVLWNSGSVVTARIAGLDTTAFNLPYRVDNSSGTPSKSTAIAGWTTICPMSGAAVTYSVNGFFPISAIHATSGAFDNTNSAKRGMKFSLPFGARAIGMQWYNANNTADYTIQIMNEAGDTVLSSSDTLFEGNASAAANTGTHRAFFDNPVTLAAGTTYRAVVVPSAASAAVYALQAANATYAPGFPGLGSSLYTYYNGSWNDTTDSLPVMDILLDQIDVGSSGGGAHIIGG
jgi:hypothetical protein